MSERFPDIATEDMTPAQRAFADRILSFSLNGLKGPFEVMLRAPEIAGPLLDAGDRIRFSSGLDDRQLELGGITHARCWSDSYEWALHAPRALKAGVDGAVVEAIRTGRTPVFDDPGDRAVYEFALQLSGRRSVDDAAFGAL